MWKEQVGKNLEKNNNAYVQKWQEIRILAKSEGLSMAQ